MAGNVEKQKKDAAQNKNPVQNLGELAQLVLEASNEATEDLEEKEGDEHEVEPMRVPKYFKDLIRQIKSRYGFKSYAEAVSFLLSQIGGDTIGGAGMEDTYMSPLGAVDILSKRAQRLAKGKAVGVTSLSMKEMAEANMWFLTWLTSSRMTEKALEKLFKEDEKQELKVNTQLPNNPSQSFDDIGGEKNMASDMLEKALLFKMFSQPDPLTMMLMMKMMEGKEAKLNPEIQAILQQMQQQNQTFLQMLMEDKEQKRLQLMQETINQSQQEFANKVYEAFQNAMDTFDERLKEVEKKLSENTDGNKSDIERLKDLVTLVSEVNTMITNYKDAVLTAAKEFNIPEDKAKEAVESGASAIKEKFANTILELIGDAGKVMLQSFLGESGGKTVETVDVPPPPKTQKKTKPKTVKKKKEKPQLIKEIEKEKEE